MLAHNKLVHGVIFKVYFLDTKCVYDSWEHLHNSITSTSFKHHNIQQVLKLIECINVTANFGPVAA